jgi:hypothetical protein
MSVKSPLGLVLYWYLNMPTINKTDLILSYLIACYLHSKINAVIQERLKWYEKKTNYETKTFWCDGSYVGATGFVLCVGRGGSRCIEDHVDRSGNLFVISYIRWFCTVFMSLPHMIRYLEYFITSIVLNGWRRRRHSAF